MPSIPKKREDTGMNKVHQIYDTYLSNGSSYVEDEERLLHIFGLNLTTVDDKAKGWYNDDINRGKPDKVREA